MAARAPGLRVLHRNCRKLAAIALLTALPIVLTARPVVRVPESAEAVAARAAVRDATGQVSGGLGRMRRALRGEGCPSEARALFDDGLTMARGGLGRLFDLAITSDSGDAGVADAGLEAQNTMALLTSDVRALEQRWVVRCGKASQDGAAITFEPLPDKNMRASLEGGDPELVANGTFVLNVLGPTPVDFVTMGSTGIPWDPAEPFIYPLPSGGSTVLDLDNAHARVTASDPGERLIPVFFLAAGPDEVRDVVGLEFDPARAKPPASDRPADAGLTIQTPEGLVIEDITKDQEFVVRLVVPRQDDTEPEPIVTVTLATKDNVVKVPVKLTGDQSGFLRYQSQVLTWNADRGFLTSLQEAWSGEFVGLYRYLDAGNGDVVTVQYGPLMFPFTVYETWVQRGIANVEKVLLDASERVFAELDAVAKAREDGAIDPALADRTERDGKTWIAFIDRTLDTMRGLANDRQRYFVGLNLTRLLLTDPSTWNVLSSEPGAARRETFGPAGTSRRESEAIQRGLQLAENARDEAWHDAVTDTLLRGYAAFAAISGGEDLWILLHAAINGSLATGDAVGFNDASEVRVPLTDATGEDVGSGGVARAAGQLGLGLFLTKFFSTRIREGSAAAAESRAARDARLSATDDLDVGTYQGPTTVIVGTNSMGGDAVMVFPNGRPPNQWAGRHRGIDTPALTPSGTPLSEALTQEAVGTKLVFPGPRPGDPPVEVELGSFIGGGGYGNVYEGTPADPSAFGEPVVIKVYRSSSGKPTYGEQLGEFYLAGTQNTAHPIPYKKTLTAVLEGPAPHVVRQRLAGDPDLQERIRSGEIPFEQVPDGVEFQWSSKRPLPGSLQDAVLTLYDNVEANGLLADDLKLDNIYFRKTADDSFEAGVLDPDLISPAQARVGPVVARRELFAFVPGTIEGGGRPNRSLGTVQGAETRDLLYADPKLFKYYTAERHGFVDFEVVSRADLPDAGDVLVIGPVRDTDNVLVLTNRGRIDRDRLLDRWPDIGQHRPDTPRFDPFRGADVATEPAFTQPGSASSFFLPGAQFLSINLLSRPDLPSDLIEHYKLVCGEGFRVPDSLGGGIQMSCTAPADSSEDPDDLIDRLNQDPRVRFAERDGVDEMQASDDPYLTSRGSWGQPYDDLWALKRIGLTGGGDAGWPADPSALTPVTVAVIDSGLDYMHPDLAAANVWRNPGEKPNGIDDDRNGYIDDLIGWNFVDRDNNPWDYTGHGTHVAGVIAGAIGNGEGIAGINPAVRIMPLKVLNTAGKSRRTRVARAIVYAVDNGARVINLSLGGPTLSKTEQLAIDYAHAKGVLVVAAAGNAGAASDTYNPGGLRHVLSVAATDVNDRRAGFSNWGQSIDLSAPGVDVLSLRARRTDFFAASGAKGYERGSAFVGEGARYMRGTGTSFAAPFVTGVASLVLSVNPALTAGQVERMLLMAADDVEVPGWDQFTGAGRLNAPRALTADPDSYLAVRIASVAPVQVDGRTVIQVRGAVEGSSLRAYVVLVGPGSSPGAWREVERTEGRTVGDGVIADIPVSAFRARGLWTIRVVAESRAGDRREARGTLTIE